jgi:hypothetical protein
MAAVLRSEGGHDLDVALLDRVRKPAEVDRKLWNCVILRNDELRRLQFSGKDFGCFLN